jgi:hypothetical protein
MSADSFTIEAKVSRERIDSLLCSAFWVGSNYWYEDLDIHKLAPGLTRNDFSEGGKMQKPDDYSHWSTLVPLTPGCSTKFRVSEDSPWSEGDSKIPAGVTVKDDVAIVVFDLTSIERGLKLFATDEKVKHHWANFLSENDDAETGDVFLQLCVFGEVIFG